MDMDMGTHIYKDYLQEAVEKGTVPMAIVDEAVRRILSVKVWLGLFENPYVPEARTSRPMKRASRRRISPSAARQPKSPWCC